MKIKTNYSKMLKDVYKYIKKCHPISALEGINESAGIDSNVQKRNNIIKSNLNG